MSLEYLQIIVPFVGMVVNMLAQVFSFKYISRLRLLKSEYFGFVIGLLAMFISQFYIYSKEAVDADNFIVSLITNFIIYLSLEFCYFTFINLGETARRVRLLRELYDSRGGLSIEEILKQYNAKEIVERRINRLVNNGQVLLKDSRYYIGSPVMLLIAKIIIAVKLIVLGKRSEFDQFKLKLNNFYKARNSKIWYL